MIMSLKAINALLSFIMMITYTKLCAQSSFIVHNVGCIDNTMNMWMIMLASGIVCMFGCDEFHSRMTPYLCTPMWICALMYVRSILFKYWVFFLSPMSLCECVFIVPNNIYAWVVYYLRDMNMYCDPMKGGVLKN